MSQESPKPTSNNYGSEACVIIMAVFTILSGFSFMGSSYFNYLSVVIALGLSTIALAILHLAKVLASE